MIPDLYKTDVWLGLENINGAGSCQGANCEGFLKWSDGRDFVYHAQVMDGLQIQSNGASNQCHYFSQATFTVELADCSLLKLGVCQSDLQCPGKQICNNCVFSNSSAETIDLDNN